MTSTAAVLSFPVDGKVATVDRPVATSTAPSVFLIGLHKAGSTLLNSLMRPICRQGGLVSANLSAELWKMGVPISMLPADLSAYFQPKGYVFGGFRGWQFAAPVPQYASGRTVFLMRDPRDIVVSHYYSASMSHVAPGKDTSVEQLRVFHETRAAVRAMSVGEYALEKAPETRANIEHALERLSEVSYRTWRYEDVIFEKRRWADEMIAYLELEVSPEAVGQIVEQIDIVPAQEQPEKHIRKVTPGDHREKLTAAEIATLDEIFAPLLERFDYR